MWLLKQRLTQNLCCVAHKQTASTNVINVLWSLMEAGVEELKLLQTAILLITTDSVVQHDALAKVRVNPSSVVLRRCEQCQAPRVWCVC